MSYLFGLIETGEYHKWKKKRQNPNLPADFVKGLSVLVVGAGSAGKRHLANAIALGVEKLAVVDPREDRRAEVVERYGDIETYATEDEAYSAGKYDAVIVCNPPIFHIESSTKAVKNGAHVLSEKNISNKVEGVEEFLKLADEQKKIVGMVCMYRYYDSIQYVKELLDKNAIGKVFSAQITFSETMADWHPWEKVSDFYSSQKALGGSELYGENHTIDFTRWFFGEVKEVKQAYVARLANVTVDADDFAEYTTLHENGTVVHTHLDAFGRRHRKDMWLYGESGTILWDSYMGGNKVEWYNAETKKTEVFVGKVSRNDAFAMTLANFFESIKFDSQPLVNGWDALKTLKTTVLAEQSAKSQESKVIKM